MLIYLLPHGITYAQIDDEDAALVSERTLKTLQITPATATACGEFANTEPLKAA